MEIWHLRFSSDGRHPLFPEETARRAAVLLIVSRAAPWLVVFGMADDHAHVVVACSRAQAGKVSRSIVMGLRPIAGIRFEPPYIKPVEDRAHLKRLVEYCIEQPVKHGLAVHPAVWSGSCFSDVVGARFIEEGALCLSEALPRYRPWEAWVASGLNGAGIRPITDAQIVGMGLDALRDAASFAVCANPLMTGRTPRESQARSIVVVLGRRAGFQSRDIAVGLGVTTEAVRKLGKRTVDDRALKATLLRMAIVGNLARGPNK